MRKLIKLRPTFDARQLFQVVLGIFVLCIPVLVSAAPVTLDSSSSADATANAAQRRTFFDSIGKKHWSFYFNGSAIEYARSADSQSWSQIGSLSYGTSNFALSYRVIAGVSYVFLAVEANNHDIVLRRGVISQTSISFDAGITVFDGTSSTNRYTKPSVALDGNNNLWVASVKVISDSAVSPFRAYVRRSQNIANANLSTFQAEQAVGSASGGLRDLVIMPRDGAEMYLLLNTEAPRVVGYHFDGSSWSAANSGGELSWFSFSTGAFSSFVKAITVSGNDVYLGGFFVNAGGAEFNDVIVRYDGTQFYPLGTGLNGVVEDIEVVGSRVYAIGGFTDAGGVPDADGVAFWDGTQWNALGTGVTGQANEIEVSGTDVYIAGNFLNAGGNPNADRIAHWDGTSWNALGTGLNNWVRTLELDGTNIYAAGNFVDAGGNPNADRIARWDGASWNALGTGLGGTVYTLTISGNNVYAGGLFLDAGGDPNADRIAFWNGTSWQALGTGLDNRVYDVMVSGSLVYATGWFQDAGGDPDADGIAVWNGTSWSGFASGIANNTDGVLAEWGSEILVGGNFSSIVGMSLMDKYFARWSGSAWKPVVGGIGEAPGSKKVEVITVGHGGVYIGGLFEDAGGQTNGDRITFWDGTRFQPLGTGLSSLVSAIEISGSDVYVGGSFVDAGGNPNADRIARWDGTSWNALGPGLANGSVQAIAISGSNVFVGGNFLDAGADPNADRIARWDGTNWNAMGTGVGSQVFAMQMLGSDLYVGGTFDDVAGDPNADRIARWDGASWHALATGLNANVQDLTLYGSDLLVLGNFSNAGGDPNADIIALWDGTNWSAIGNGLGGAISPLAVAVYQNEIYVGGWLNDIGGDPDADNLGRWDGTSWGSVDGVGFDGFNNFVHYLEASSDGLYVGGGFSSLTGSDGTAGASLITKLAPAVSANSDGTTEVSSFTDSSGNLHVLYTDTSDRVVYRRYDATADLWQSTVMLNSVTSSSPSLAQDPGTGNLYAFWIESGNVVYKRAVTPFAAANWDASTTTLATNGDITAVSATSQPGGGHIVVTYTSGTAGSYNVIADSIQIGRSISGIIRQNGIGIANATVRLRTADGTTFIVSTDSSGAFSFSNIPDDSYTLTAEKNGVVLANQALSVSGVDISGMNYSVTATSLNTPIYSMWNGYLDMLNVLELTNKSATPLTVTVDVLGLSGTDTLPSASASFTIPANSQQDVVLNQLGNFTPDAYGLLRLTLGHTDFDGRVSFYRISADEPSEFDFAYAIPFLNSFAGTTFVNYNTFNPETMSTDSAIAVYNWLGVANAEMSDQDFTLRYYDQSGLLLESTSITVPALGRIDVDGGHVTAGLSQVGLIEIIPDDASAAYVATLMRYGSRDDDTYAFAFGAHARPGNGEVQYVPLSRFTSSASFVELANVTASPLNVTVDTFAGDGTMLDSNFITLGAYAQLHVPATALPENSSGYLRLTPQSANSLIAQGMLYHFNQSSRRLAGTERSFAWEAFGSILYGSYNLYLDSENWLRVINTSNGSVSLTVTINPGASPLSTQTFTLPPNARFDYGLHDSASFGTASDSYGTVLVSTPFAGDIVAETLRAKRDEQGAIDFTLIAPVK